MDGLRISGKAFAVFEDLRQIAEQNKGKTLAQVLYEQRKEQLDRAAAKQFGVSVEVYRGWLECSNCKPRG